MSGRFKISDGDWICSQEGCENINYARRTECHKCRYPRPKFAPKLKKVGSEIGRHAAKKSGGLFSAEDWQCSMCSNINWARRSECNVCDHPKMGKVEERTGIGGGFNEREEVEYIKRESDGEYDDFGRKKKKVNTSSNKKVYERL
ncbi:Zinc finger Ran-binding domain-containing protein 2 [Oopsacas minuta]|uniref:Zinc finger Ran-binding domain-containing protein 2 n=1 Tax=Oopsacas minuta TaxID=111878 RepID=A0AAV7K6Y6_9METZ|nr:Zinc finger Ran-binding domain-containing protein 2 [Oopsacas minuta]